MTQDPFKDSNVISISTAEVVAWTQANDASRLFLPPIQRSLVWKNQQIVNYWDSLLRSYPAGLMMVHRPNQNFARTTEGQTREIRPEDFELFDGQQRLTAILLGYQAGQLNNRIKLWVDLKMEPSADSGLLFQLRVSSSGQPFGYQPQWPNEKHALGKRRYKAAEWLQEKNLPRFDSLEAFVAVEGKDLIDADQAGPLQLHEVVSLVKKGKQPAISELTRHWGAAVQPAKIEIFVHALEGALKLPIPFQLIDPKVVKDGQEYVRFFGRLGQGGTALSNDELTYSIIKYQQPHVHDCIKEIMKGPAGRVASEVNLVLAALRVAKVLAPWEGATEWEIIGRPYPGFVSRLKELSRVEAEFQKMILFTQGGRLKELLESIRQRLEYNETTNPSGLPVILLARLPHQLVDVLLLMESQCRPEEEEAYFLPAFVLYWLLFVVDAEKAANIIFSRYYLNGANWQWGSDNQLIRLFEEQGVSRRLPGFELLGQVRDEIQRGNHLLRGWGDRFTVLDTNKDHQTGDALRVLSTNGELIRRALLWLQREYLAGRFPNYDPTSSRDEDLPIDLDHLIPHSKFGFDWRYRTSSLNFDDPNENFRHLRGTVGNSLGNYRWLDTSDNRSRQADKIGNIEGERDNIEKVPDWNALIERNPWSEADVAAFQKMIDLRTIALYEHLLTAGGLKDFVTESVTVSNEPS
jgi:hypothetical protein